VDVKKLIVEGAHRKGKASRTTLHCEFYFTPGSFNLVAINLPV